MLHVVTRFAQGGSERDVLHQIAWEQDRGYDVSMAIGQSLDSDPPVPGVRVHPAPALIPRLHPVSDARALRQLHTIVRSTRPDVVFTHQSKAGILGRMAARGTVRHIAHTVHMASFGRGYSSVASRAQATAERYCARFTDIIVCVGHELRDSYLKHEIGNPNLYATMRTPVDIDAYAALRGLTDTDRRGLREKLELPLDGPVAVAVGALEPRKRAGLVIDRLGPMLRAGRLALAFAGDGPERSALEDRARALGVAGAVRFLGHVSPAADVFGCADLLVMASRVEGVPRVVIEALAAGLPIVATEVEGLREVPEAPIRVVARDGAGLAEAVSSLIAGPRPASVPLHALEDWRGSSVNAQLEAIYGRLLGSPSPRRR